MPSPICRPARRGPAQATRPGRRAKARRPATQTPGGRLDHLDSLRGLAAVVVVVHHALLALTADDSATPAWSVFNIVLLGRPAVVLFFVLSGFVLTLHLQATRQGFWSFAVRRLLRLMPPYLVAIVGAAVLFGLTAPHGPTGLSPWFDAQWRDDLGAGDVLRSVLLLAGPRQFPLDHVAWSLVHEVRLSLALPLLLWLARRCGPAGVLAIGTGTTLLAEGMLARWPGLFPAGLHGFRFDVQGIGLSLILTARFGLAVTLGTVLANAGPQVRAAMRRPGAGLFGLGAGLALLSCSDELLMAPGAALLVAAVAWSPGLSRGLGAAPLLWVGRLSFSLYLVHLPVMLTCGHAGSGPAWVRLAIGLALSVPVAAALSQGVEEPAIRWSRTGARWVSQRLAPHRDASVRDHLDRGSLASRMPAGAPGEAVP